MKYKNPLYELKYVEGLGDLVRVFLHSKLIKPVLVLIMKNAEYCTSCSQRAYALNILFPMPIWKFYFKEYDTMKLSFEVDAKVFGYDFNNPSLESFEESTPKNHIELGNFDMNQVKYEGFELMQKSECDFDHIRMVNMVFKRIS